MTPTEICPIGTMERMRRCEDALRNLLTYDRVERPAFRSMPLGAPNSTVRIANDKLIALEDAALSALTPMTKPEQGCT